MSVNLLSNLTDLTPWKNFNCTVGYNVAIPKKSRLHEYALIYASYFAFSLFLFIERETRNREIVNSKYLYYSKVLGNVYSFRQQDLRASAIRMPCN